MQCIRLILLATGILAASMFYPHKMQAQVSSPVANSMRGWRNTSRGLNARASLAARHTRSNGRTRLPPAPRWRRPYTSRGTLYSAPYYAITTPWAIPDIRSDPYPSVNTQPNRKPFAGARPAPNAIDRYWPLLFEAREDPKTGLIIWQLP